MSDVPSSAACLPGFMRDQESALRYAMRNIGNDEEPLDLSSDDDVGPERRLAGVYVKFAHKVCRDGGVRVYRLIAIPEHLPWRESLRLNCLGKSWSKQKSGTGIYNDVPHRGPNRNVLLVADVRAESIDWGFGLEAFVEYGRSQWEVSLKRDQPVRLIEVDGERLKPPIVGSTGDARDWWQDCRVDERQKSCQASQWRKRK